MSGIAPRARLSVYKACLSTEDRSQGNCASSASAAAIDQAVADGVDVINFSVGSGTSFLDATDFSFLFAADAGVAVATSAGNEGPGAFTANGRGPWVMSVGASTHDRAFEGTVTLGDGQVFTGASWTSGTPELTLVDSADAVLAGEDLDQGEKCYPNTLDPAVVAGKIVLCKRGDIPRVDKSLAVYLAGGAGMIMYNPNPASLNADLHSVPSIHVDHVDGPVIKQYIADTIDIGGTPTASLSGGVQVEGQGSVMAGFSSRGPFAQNQDIIAPDVTAPGVDILAATSQYGDQWESWAGTSMASPHVAGLLALVTQAQPEWSPMMAKSALMTTARQDVLKEDGITPADPFDMGSGHIDPSMGWFTRGSFLNPGLVYDSGWNDWLAFLCGAEPAVIGAATCLALESFGYSTDASDFNSPGIAVGELVGSQTVTRTVTSVQPDTKKGHGHHKHRHHKHPTWYKAVVDAPEGYDIQVSPKYLKVKPGETATYEVTITNDGTAPIGEFTYGSLTWHGLGFRGWGYEVYSPIAVRAFEVDAPGELLLSSTDGSTSFDIKTGYDGEYIAGSHGLVEADLTFASVIDDPDNFLFNWQPGTYWEDYIPVENAAHLRFSLFNDFVDGETDDLDMFLWFVTPDFQFIFVGQSGNALSDEQIDFAFPWDGLYNIVVHAYETDGPDADFTLFTWIVPLADIGNLTVTGPTEVTVGGTYAIAVSWSGLD
jgi:hypothetical protein